MKASNINAIYLATVPFMDIYALPNGLQLNWLLVGLLVIFNHNHISRMSFLKKRSNEIRWFIAIMIIGLMGTLCNIGSIFFDTTLYLHNLFSIVVFFITLVIITSNCNVDVFKKFLFVCGAVASIVCLFQRAQLLLTGSFEVDVFVPGLIVNRDLETFSTNRVSSFFTEPAHLAIYLLPIYYISLYARKIPISLLCAAGILFSGSSTGFVLLFALSFIYMLKNNRSKKQILMVTIMGIIAFILVNIYFPDVLLSNINKIESTNSNDLRHLGPLSYIKYMDIGQMIFGIGLNQLTEFLKCNGVFLISQWGEEINANYANAVIYSFLSYGFLGFLSCLQYFNSTIRYNKSDLGFIVFALGILLSDQVLFNRNLLYLIVFLIYSKKILNNNESTIYNK